MSAHDWLQQVPSAVLGLIATVLGAIIVRMLRRLYWATQEAGEHTRMALASIQTGAPVYSLRDLTAVTPEQTGGSAVRLWEQIRYRAKAVLAGVGVAVVAAAEWLVESPDTARALEHVVPAPFTQLVPLVLGAAAVALVHRVPNVPRPEPVAESAPAVLALTPAEQDATPEPVPAPPLQVPEPAPAAHVSGPPTAFIPLPRR